MITRQHASMMSAQSTDIVDDSSPQKSKAGKGNALLTHVPKNAVRRLEIPTRVDELIDMPPAPLFIQRHFGWNKDDMSANIVLKGIDELTLYRNPVARSTDGVRAKIGVTKGVHVWEVQWDPEERGTHAAVGVATKKAPLHAIGYQSLVGTNDQSWGWNLVRNKLNSGVEGGGITYPAWLKPDEKFTVPEKFQVVLDMDAGTLSFVADDQYLGVAFRGLKGRILYPMVSTVWGQCEVTLKYIGGLGPNPLSLKSLCRRVIRRQIDRRDLEKEVKDLEIPTTLKAYLLYKYEI